MLFPTFFSVFPGLEKFGALKNPQEVDPTDSKAAVWVQGLGSADRFGSKRNASNCQELSTVQGRGEDYRSVSTRLAGDSSPTELRPIMRAQEPAGKPANPTPLY